MPTYDYVCEKCGHQFEEFQSIKADPIRICPNCDTESVHRVISPGNGFIFKGSGFYITDYRSDTYKKDKEKAEKKPVASSKTEKPKKTEQPITSKSKK